ncbi:hypothetical protein J4Q44_G00342750 [Coregonus suidteri]|uniref:Uncharacterized protein n=1 Tax=Coregonus suidteri TaxID=861788 RepID=A0AAN8KT89_9TELE
MYVHELDLVTDAKHPANVTPCRLYILSIQAYQTLLQRFPEPEAHISRVDLQRSYSNLLAIVSPPSSPR